MHIDPALNHIFPSTTPPQTNTSTTQPHALRTVPLFKSHPDPHTLSYTPVHSEAWIIASRAFVKYALHSHQSRKLQISLAYMSGSDEFFFATLAYNSHFRRAIIPKAMRLVLWKVDGIHAGQHPYWIDHMDDNGMYKFETVLREASQLHARKFRVPESPLMDTVDSFAADTHRQMRTERVWQHQVQMLRARFCAEEEHVTEKASVCG